jgi:hypothetical protein
MVHTLQKPSSRNELFVTFIGLRVHGARSKAGSSGASLARLALLSAEYEPDSRQKPSNSLEDLRVMGPTCNRPLQYGCHLTSASLPYGWSPISALTASRACSNG